MAPPRTGSVEPCKRDGKPAFRARIRLVDGFRQRVDVPDKFCTPAGGVSARDRAEQWAAARQQREDETQELYKARQEQLRGRQAGTVDSFAEDVFDRREAEGKTSVSRERRMWKARISDRLGAFPIATVTKEQIEDFRDYLDGEVRKRMAGGKADGISGKTAMILWTYVRTVFREAVNCRDRSKRVRTDDPTHGVLPPLKTRSRKKTFIYPSEFATLMACKLVPLEWRETYAVAAYLYLRPGELRALTFEHVNLGAGVVSVVAAYDEEADEVKPTKTEKGQREVPIPPMLLPLLKMMRERSKATDPVAPLLATVADNKRAILLREHLDLAKLNRPRLLEDTATTMRVNFRSLRDSGITWEALAGTPVERIQARAGHEHISTTIGYVKSVEDLHGRFGTPFGPLPFGPKGPPIGPKAPDRAKKKLRLLDSNQRPGG